MCHKASTWNTGIAQWHEQLTHARRKYLGFKQQSRRATTVGMSALHSSYRKRRNKPQHQADEQLL